MLSEWCFHLITCPWHTALLPSAWKDGAPATQPSGCAEIPQVPDTAFRHGALTSLDLLRGGGIPAFPVHRSMEGLHSAVLGSLGLASRGIGGSRSVLAPS